MTGRGPNGATGARSLAVERANIGKGAGEILFYGSVVVTTAQVLHGDTSPEKGALDIGMGYVGLRGGPIGAIVATSYFVIDNRDMLRSRDMGQTVNTNTCHSPDGTRYGPRQ